MNEEKLFSDQEAEAILSEAARIDGVGQSQQSRQHLITAAAELGISKEAVLEAELRIAEGRQLETDRSEYLRQRNGRLVEEVWSYLGTSVMLLGINFFTSGMKWTFPHMWSIWVVGILLACLVNEVMTALFGSPEKQQRAFEKWRTKKQRRSKQPMMPDVDDLLDHYFAVHASDDKLGAIRVVRRATGLGVGDAKSLVDEYYAERGLA